MDREFVLIVQADAGLRRDATDQLQEGGVTAIGVASAEQALSILRRVSPAAVVLDTHLPTMTARALRETMLGEPSLATIPVIVTTPVIPVPSSLRPATVLRRPFAVGALLVWVREALLAAKKQP